MSEPACNLTFTDGTAMTVDGTPDEISAELMEAMRDRRMARLVQYTVGVSPIEESIHRPILLNPYRVESVYAA